MNKAPISAAMLIEVSRTAVPMTVLGYTITVEALMINESTSSDWEGCYTILKLAAARRIAAELNKYRPWVTVPISAEIEVIVHEGVVLPAQKAAPTSVAIRKMAAAAKA